MVGAAISPLIDVDTWRLVTKNEEHRIEVEYERPDPRGIGAKQSHVDAGMGNRRRKWLNQISNMHDDSTGHFFVDLAGISPVHFRPSKWRDRVMRGRANHNTAVTSEPPAIGV